MKSKTGEYIFMHKYFKALTVQWFILSFFFSLATATFICTYLLANITKSHPLEATITIIIISSIFAFSLFYEWYHAHPHTFWGRKFMEILKVSFERNKYLEPKDVMGIVLTFIALIIFIIGCGFCAWKYPNVAMFCNWMIGIAGATLGTYMFKEEFNAPMAYKQRSIFWISLLLLTVSIVIIWFLSINNVQYDDENKYVGLLLVSVGAWLAFGIVGTISVSFCKMYWTKILNIFI